MSNFSKVGIFMKTFGQEVKNKPSFSTDKINKLRLDLIKEELSELTDAMNNKDLLEVADALTDILYVTYGAGHAFGIDLDKCFDEVQNSNMSKLDENGKPIYNEHGKVMKGPNYFKPDLSKFVNWISILKSIAGALWVMPPTEILSIPVFAIDLTFLRFIFPEASVW